MLDHMKQILVQLDEKLAAQLESYIPGSSRKRSEFIRNAIARALLAEADLITAAAYAKNPMRRENGWALPDEAYLPSPAEKRMLDRARRAKAARAAKAERAAKAADAAKRKKRAPR